MFGKDKNGKTVDTKNTKWHLVNNNIGTLSELGIFKSYNTPGVYPNAIEISLFQDAESGTIEKQSKVDVTITGTLNTGKIYPELGLVETNKTVHFTAVGFDESNVQLHNTIVKWSLTDNSVGEIDQYGNFTAYEKTGLYNNLIKAEILQRHILKNPIENKLGQ